MTRRIRPPGYPTPWQRIVEACWKGAGIRLSFDEVHQLKQDCCITERAEIDYDAELARAMELLEEELAR